MNLRMKSRYKRISSEFEMSFHAHIGCEIFMVHEGEGSFFVRDRVYPLQPGDVFWINSTDMHKVHIKPGQLYSRSSIEFNQHWPERWTPVFPQSRKLLSFLYSDRFEHRIAMTAEQREHLSLLFQQLNQLHFQHKELKPDWQYEMRALTIMTQILFIVNDSLQYKTEASFRSISAHQQLSQQVIDFIETNLKEKIGVADIAQTFHLDKSHLCRLFKKEVGTTIGDYIKNRRVLLAKYYILTQKNTLHWIAENTGLRNPPYLCRVFKEVSGLTPKQYLESYYAEL